MHDKHWLLPDGIDEILPPQTAVFEALRRELLDLFERWGYDLVLPPLVEYLDSLLTGVGGELGLQTFKLTDQLTGRMLGIRADITPQAARIDAHQMRREGPNRLCYIGNVLHTRADRLDGVRAPVQVGAELYGHVGLEADLEILLLMLEALSRAGINDIYLDLGHVGVFRGLARDAGLGREQELALFDALQRKAASDIAGLVQGFGLSAAQQGWFTALAGLSGDQILPKAREVLVDAGADTHKALGELERIAELLRRHRPNISLHFDLAELRGYHYHTGVVFAAFMPGRGQEIARGGRYDDAGRAFGHARPACGFSTDLKALLKFGGFRGPPRSTVFAPWVEDPTLEGRVAELRAKGVRVIYGLPEQQGDSRDMGCTEILEFIEGEWRLNPV